jgi:hypothetical protein
MEPTLMGPTEKLLCLGAQTPNVVLNKTGRWIMSRIVIVILIYHSHKPTMYSSQSIIRIIKSRRMRWEGYVARMGEKRNARGKARGKETTRKTKT